MIALAAIDLRGGHAVQLVGGVPAVERIRLDAPLEIAARWVSAGFRGLHLVDLDAALGDGDNAGTLIRIIESCRLPVQVGGGLRSSTAVRRMLDAGAARVIVGTRAVEDRKWVGCLAERHPGRVVVAADLRADMVVVRGWTAGSGIRADRLLRELSDLPLAGILVTDVDREGGLEGANTALFADLVAATPHAVQAAGGIRDLEDLRALRGVGVRAAVLGMALYTGVIDARAAASEFDE